MTDRQTYRTMTEKMFKKRIEIKKTHRQKIQSDKLYNSDNCQNTDSSDTYAQLGGCCSSSVDANKTLTHFSSRCQS